MIRQQESRTIIERIGRAYEQITQGRRHLLQGLSGKPYGSSNGPLSQGDSRATCSRGSRSAHLVRNFQSTGASSDAYVIATAKALLKPTENKVKFAELEATHATLKEPKVMKVDEARELAGKIAENRLQSTALREFSDTLGNNLSEENGPRKLKAIFMEANRLILRFNEFAHDATLASWANECETAYLATATLTQPDPVAPVETRGQDTPAAAAA